MTDTLKILWRLFLGGAYRIPLQLGIGGNGAKLDAARITSEDDHRIVGYLPYHGPKQRVAGCHNGKWDGAEFHTLALNIGIRQLKEAAEKLEAQSGVAPENLRHGIHRAEVKELVKAVSDILDEYWEQLPLPLRQVLYIAVTRSMVGKIGCDYERLCELLNHARRLELIPMIAFRVEGFSQAQAPDWLYHR